MKTLYTCFTRKKILSVCLLDFKDSVTEFYGETQNENFSF